MTNINRRPNFDIFYVLVLSRRAKRKYRSRNNLLRIKRNKFSKWVSPNFTKIYINAIYY